MKNNNTTTILNKKLSNDTNEINVDNKKINSTTNSINTESNKLITQMFDEFNIVVVRPKYDKEYWKRYTLINKEKLAKKSKDYYLASKEQIRRRQQKYYINNPDKFNKKYKKDDKNE